MKDGRQTPRHAGGPDLLLGTTASGHRDTAKETSGFQPTNRKTNKKNQAKGIFRIGFHLTEAECQLTEASFKKQQRYTQTTHSEILSRLIPNRLHRSPRHPAEGSGRSAGTAWKGAPAAGAAPAGVPPAPAPVLAPTGLKQTFLMGQFQLVSAPLEGYITACASKGKE